jgi:DNA-directed RNA polymerase specialized sigma24 family protein
VTRVVCANRDWRLLTVPGLGVDQAAFVGRVAGRLQQWQATEGHAQIFGGLVERAVVHEYCRLLHQAIGMEGTAAQERALIELWNYVTPIIRKYLRDDAQARACANDVLITVWRKHGDVRDPGIARELTDRPQPLLAADTMAATETASAYTEEHDRAAVLERAIEACLDHMRGGAIVVVGLVLHERTAAELAAELGVAAANVHVIKLRALRKLRRCRALLQALGRALAPDANGGDT